MTMSLIPCPACDERVSQQAPTCPHCGHPIATPASEAPPLRISVEHSRATEYFLRNCFALIVLIALGVGFFCG
jgi:predicted amidophosphoribosyltransferase